jgi:methionine synthase I (cobalamin-dependent)
MKNSLFRGRPVLTDGAMGTMLLGGGASVACCLEALNTAQPESIGRVHEQYLQAGAEIVETNTFGANAVRLQHFGLGERVRELNIAGATVARRSVDAMGADERRAAFVAGAIGPLGLRGEMPLSEMRAVFAEQIRALADGGVDLLIAETMMSVDEAEQVVLATREVAPQLRIAVLMTVDAAGNCLDGLSPETAAARLEEIGADAIGCNCSFGPESVLETIRRMRAVTALPLVAMPGAGLPLMVDGRGVYPVMPDEMARFACALVEAGANWVGGCCGTTPEYIRAMRSAMQGKIFDEREATAGVVDRLQEVA